MRSKSIFLKKPKREPYFKEATSFYGFSLASLSKERMRCSESDRGLFIQYPAKKYAERARDLWGVSGAILASHAAV